MSTLRTALAERVVVADGAMGAMLQEPSRIGVELSEDIQLHPEQSTDAIVVHHPEAKYFSV